MKKNRGPEGHPYQLIFAKRAKATQYRKSKFFRWERIYFIMSFIKVNFNGLYTQWQNIKL